MEGFPVYSLFVISPAYHNIAFIAGSDRVYQREHLSPGDFGCSDFYYERRFSNEHIIFG